MLRNHCTDLLSAIVFAALSAPALGATFTVNSTKDLPDLTPLGDGLVDVDLNEPGNQITLRAAIMEANALGGSDTINLPAGTFKLTIKAANPDSDAVGDLDVSDTLTILGTGMNSTILDGKKLKDRVFQIQGATCTIRDLTVRKGRAAERGGGLFAENGASLELERVRVEKCKTGDDGGGVAVQEAVVTLLDCLFAKNRAGDDSGAVDLVSTPNPSILRGCTFTKNKAKREGGAVEVSDGDAVVENCTFDRNKAEDGGAMSFETGGTTSLTNCTLRKNKADSGSGIHEDVNEGGADAINVVNSIFASKKQNEYSGDGLTSLGSNIDTGSTCGFTSPGDLENTDPKLKTLKDNGGSTPTCALKSGSPAIDAGNDALDAATDQRGFGRVDIAGVGTAVSDIGAFEVQ